MAEEPSARPGVYLHVEFGVSWTPKKAPRGHHLTYKSKALRKPRQRQPERLIAPDTHHLDMPSAHLHQYVTQRGEFPQYYFYSGAPHRFDPATASWYFPPQQQQQHQYTHQPALQQGLYGSLRDGHQSQHHARPHRIQQQRRSTFEPSQNNPMVPLFQESELQRRESRSLSRGRHERGSSASAPLSDNSWDADPEPIGSSALPCRNRDATVDTQKALPATPDQFRLGEHSMPWSPHPVPGDFVERGNAVDRMDKPRPGQSPRFPDRDRGRITEMQSLATALMTVDNGFEDQWWYQGSRTCDVAGDLISPTTGHHADVEDVIESHVLPNPSASSVPVSPPSAMDSDHWAQYRIDEDQSPSGRPQTSHSSLVDIVSPVSGSGSTYSFATSTRGRLRRSVTTRSEELR